MIKIKIPVLKIYKRQLLRTRGGLPWWRSGWESACQCRGHGFEPWSGRIPHAAEQLGPWATTTETAHLEPVLCNKRGHDSERPAHRDEEWPSLAATRESPSTETKTQHSNQSINQQINLKKKKLTFCKWVGAPDLWCSWLCTLIDFKLSRDLTKRGVGVRCAGTQHYAGLPPCRQQRCRQPPEHRK